jgi:creatinine amidohydrolase
MAINGKWRYEDLTWPEMNQAVEAGLIPVLPVGTMEQHGPHLPVKMDRWTAT